MKKKKRPARKRRFPPRRPVSLADTSEAQRRLLLKKIRQSDTDTASAFNIDGRAKGRGSRYKPPTLPSAETLHKLLDDDGEDD